MEIKLDDTTGLPELPEGYWWNVTRVKDTFVDFVRVAILQMRPDLTFWLKRPHPTKKVCWKIASSAMYWSEFSASDDLKAEILRLAVNALEDAKKVWLRESRENALAELMGDYPPKTLKE